MKTCSKCNTEKDLWEFYPHPTGSQGVMHQCRICQKAFSSEYRKRTPERQAVYAARRKEAKEGKIKTPLIPRSNRKSIGAPSTKDLSTGDVDLMRDLREEYGMTYKEIAQKFEVTREVAYKICSYVWRANG